MEHVVGATFTSFTAEEPLPRLLEDVHDGRIQVPEFQRELILEDEWIRSLLASVSLRYPIGAVMLLRSGNPDLRFGARPVGGAPTSSTEPEWLLLDGQRRVATLYEVLASGHAVRTRDDHDEPSARWYYIDVNAALDPDIDRDEAIISVPETGRTRGIDLSTAGSEWERCLFPLRLVFRADAELRRWQRGFLTHGAVEESEARSQLMDRFEGQVLQAFRVYRIPTILHGPETARWSVRVHGGPDGRSLSDRYRTS